MKKILTFVAALFFSALALAQQHSAVVYFDGMQQLGAGSIRNTADPRLYITDFTFNLASPASNATFHEVGAPDFTDAQVDAAHYGLSSWNLAITPGDTASFSGLDISQVVSPGVINDDPLATFVLTGASFDLRWSDGFYMHRAIAPTSLYDSQTFVLSDSLPPVSPAPEPEGLVMFAAGLGVLGFVSKRRTK